MGLAVALDCVADVCGLRGFLGGGGCGPMRVGCFGADWVAGQTYDALGIGMRWVFLRE